VHAERDSFGVDGDRDHTPQLRGALPRLVRRRGFVYLAVFAVAAVGAGLVRTVTTTYLPLLLAEIREALR
jgi:hypothetical protein